MSILRVNKIAASGQTSENTGSVFFDGTGDYLSLADNNDFDLPGDFTVELWVYLNSISNQSFVGNWDNSNKGWLFQFIETDNNIRFYGGNNGSLGDNVVFTWTPVVATWYHLAASRQGNTLYCFVDGTLLGTATLSTSTNNLTANTPLNIGYNPTGGGQQYTNGYISNVRVLKGTALYTSNFAPPTTELEVTPETVLVACHDGENIFAEKTGKIIAAYGDRLSSPTPTATDSPIGITTFQPGLTRSVDVTAGPVLQGNLEYNSQNFLVLPKGTTTERFPDFGAVDAASARGVFAGSRDSPATAKNNIDYLTIATTGNASDFGDLVTATREFSACSSSTRGVMGGGFVVPGVITNAMQYITIATTGNSQDFGDIITATRGTGGASSSTRGIFAGAYDSNNYNTIQYITIQSTGNTQDFGDLTDTFRYHDGMNSTTRAVFAGGGVPNSSATNIMDYVTIATTGNAVDFGDLLTAGSYYANANFSNSTRGIIGSIGATNTIEFITIATLGNSQDFGDTLAGPGDLKQGTCSSTRGVIAGGRTPSQSNTIQYITIATTGNAQDFGDLNFTQDSGAACSNGHGGLG